MAGLLILAGAVLFLTKWFLAPYLFAVGAAGMAVCFLTLLKIWSFANAGCTVLT